MFLKATLPLLALTGRSASKAVFAHYMVGSMNSSEAVQDVNDAIAAGFDGFALNTHSISSSDTWNTDAIGYLLDAADGTSFKMFISFDMSWSLDVSGLGAFLVQFTNHSQYYTTDDGRPWVSTYDGGTTDNSEWESSFIEPLIDEGVTPFFIPDFDDWSGYPTGFFDTFTVVDGAFSWESAWPSAGSTPANVSDSVDSTMVEQAQAAGKVYMMPVSTFQFKYLGSGSDWYRIGETNLPERMAQALALQPDYVEVITWNDAGESHYVGNFWPQQIAGTIEGDYADGFDHTGWQQIITPFITAFKNNATDISQITSDSVVGTLWYRTLLTSASCSSTIENYEEAVDAVNFAVILPSSDTYTIEVYSNSELIGSFDGMAGLNYDSVPGLQEGSGQSIQVLDSTGAVVASANGTKEVLAESSDSSLCNWNYEVVGLSS